MTLRRRWTPLALAVALGAAVGSGTQDVAAQSIWPERAENLRVLPADLPAENLSAVMRGFTRSLGVRCSYCHVGEEGEPLSTYDFVADEKRTKAVARRMLTLLGEVNDHLEAIERPGQTPVNMWCHTCHAGKPRPLTLEETLVEVQAQGGGADAVVERYRALREEFYGGNQYDFRPANVEAIAGRTMEAGDTATAVALLELNVEHFPERADGHERLGDVAQLQGRDADAIRHYRRALELDPEHPRAREKLERVGGR